MRIIRPIINGILTGALRRMIRQSDITDLVFCEIERRFMRPYQHARRRNPRINMQIGKHIKQYLGLRNTGRNRSPISKLIKSYTLHGV